MAGASTQTDITEDEVVNLVVSRTTDQPGRGQNEAAGHAFPIHLPSRYGVGEPEAITPADAFLSGVSSCAALLIEKLALEGGHEVGVEAEVEGHRRADDTSWFTRVEVRITLSGCDQATAAELVEGFTTGCPLYRTVEAATDVRLSWSLAS